MDAHHSLQTFSEYKTVIDLVKKILFFKDKNQSRKGWIYYWIFDTKNYVWSKLQNVTNINLEILLIAENFFKTYCHTKTKKS